MSVRQASGVQASLEQGSESVLQKERTLDLRVIALPEGLVHSEIEEDRALLGMIKDIRVNLAMLPLQSLHAHIKGSRTSLESRRSMHL